MSSEEEHDDVLPVLQKRTIYLCGCPRILKWDTHPECPVHQDEVHAAVLVGDESKMLCRFCYEFRPRRRSQYIGEYAIATRVAKVSAPDYDRSSDRNETITFHRRQGSVACSDVGVASVRGSSSGSRELARATASHHGESEPAIVPSLGASESISGYASSYNDAGPGPSNC